MGKQLKIGFGGYSDLITLTLVQRMSKGPLASGGILSGGTNGYGTYYVVTETCANDNSSTFNQRAQVDVSST